MHKLLQHRAYDLHLLIIILSYKISSTMQTRHTAEPARPMTTLLQGARGKRPPIRVFIDCASQDSYVTEDCLRRTNLRCLNFALRTH